jgi:EamA domain-containing membrane protein RarD
VVRSGEAGLYGATGILRSRSLKADNGDLPRRRRRERALGLGVLRLRLGIIAFVWRVARNGAGVVATVSVFNPLVSILIGTLLLQERLSEPLWHKIVAYAGLALALAGAVAISRSTEGGKEADPSDAGQSPLPAPAT